MIPELEGRKLCSKSEQLTGLKNNPPLLPKIFLVQVRSTAICFFHKKDIMTMISKE